MTLTPWWSSISLGGVRPPTRWDIHEIQIVGSITAIVTTKQNDLVTNEIRTVSAESRRNCSCHFRRRPLQLCRVEYVHIVEMPEAAMASEEIDKFPDNCHGMGVTGRRDVSSHGRLYPGHGVKVQHLYRRETR